MVSVLPTVDASLLAGQPFLMRNRRYTSQISLSPNQPNSIGEISNFTTQGTGVADLPLPHMSVSLCYCVTSVS